MAKLNIQDVEVYYEKYQHHKPKDNISFILIHGFLSSSISFKKLIPRLINNFSVIAVDLPGFGKSEKSLKFHYSYANYGKLIIELIKRFQLEKVAIIGHSMGGQIALQVVKQAPDMIIKLILIGSSGYLRKARRTAVYLSYLPYTDWFVKKWFEKKDVKKNFESVVFDKSLINEEMVNGYIQPFQDKNIFGSIVRLMRHREGDLSSQELNQITTPCLLVWGKEDTVVPLNIGKKLHSDLLNSQLVIFENTGHLISEERPEDLFKEIWEFL